MQYPKLEQNNSLRTLDLLKAAFNSAGEILVLFQEAGVVLETNFMADESCYQVFLVALSGKDAEFSADVKNGHGRVLHFHFQLKNLSLGFPTERYFLLTGHKEV